MTLMAVAVSMVALAQQQPTDEMQRQWRQMKQARTVGIDGSDWKSSVSIEDYRLSPMVGDDMDLAHAAHSGRGRGWSGMIRTPGPRTRGGGPAPPPGTEVSHQIAALDLAAAGAGRLMVHVKFTVHGCNSPPCVVP